MLFDNLIFDESGPFSFINITGRKDGGIIQCGVIRLDQNKNLEKAALSSI